MMSPHRTAARWAILLGASTAWACADAPTAPVEAPSLQAAKFWDVSAATRWNDRATNLLQTTLPTPPNGQAWASRMLTYLSLAQYRAVLEATEPSVRAAHPSVSAAIARASVEVLSYFYPGQTAALEQQLIDDRSAPDWPGEQNADVAAGDAIGLGVGHGVEAQAALDGFRTAPLGALATDPVPPVDPADPKRYWSSATGAARSLYGVTPFFLQPEDLMLAPPPLAYGTPEFRAALEEVYEAASGRTPDQLTAALNWDKVPPSGVFTAGLWNRIAVGLIRSHHRTEAEAARVLAFANAAAFDAQIDCFTTKFHWWTPRPSMVDARILPLVAFRTPLGAASVPNHPSYPSAHSCISGAFGAVLSDAFPSEAGWLDARVEEAGMSRVYAGIHYAFDVEAGQNIGRRAAAKALASSLGPE